ncbi:MAG: hypothetical protein ACO25K_07275 [Candidatus Fonsibacter ubiquis]
MIILIIILTVLVLVLSYTSYNLLRKNEKCEDMIKSYENYIANLSSTIEFSDKKLKEIDAREMFKSDDEIGWFFNQVQYLQDELNKFKTIK